MLICGAVVAAVGLLQGAKFGFVTNLLHQWYGSDHEIKAVAYGRVTSLMSAWNALGIFLMVNLFIAWAFGIHRPADLGKGLIAVATSLCTVCLIVSGSFASVIGLLVGIFLITFLLHDINKKIIILFIGLGIIISSSIILFRPLIEQRLNFQFGYGGPVPQTFIYRIKVWQEIYLPAVQKNLFWGINPTVATTLSWQYTESQYFSLLFRNGLIGFIAFFAWIGITLIWLIRRFRQHHGLLKPVTAIVITIIIILTITGFTNEVFSYAGTADYMWILLALTMAGENV